jgi:hypothetical protein
MSHAEGIRIQQYNGIRNYRHASYTIRISPFTPVHSVPSQDSPSSYISGPLSQSGAIPCIPKLGSGSPVLTPRSPNIFGRLSSLSVSELGIDPGEKTSTTAGALARLKTSLSSPRQLAYKGYKSKVTHNHRSSRSSPHSPLQSPLIGQPP